MAQPELSEEQKRKRRLVERRIFSLQQTFYPPVATSVSPEHLKAAARCFLPSHYMEIVEERGVGSLCGYPLCTKAAPRGNKWFELGKSDFAKKFLFCSPQCGQASEFVCRQISCEAVMFRKPVPELYTVTLLHELGTQPSSAASLASTSDGGAYGEGLSTASTAAGGASAFTSDADDETGDVDVDEDGPPELEEDIDDVRVEAVTARLRDVRC